jgi:predicted Zn-dependent peptidase
MRKDLDRTKPPVPGNPKDIKFPEHYKTKLENGIEVIALEDKRLPIVTARFLFKTGTLYDSICNGEKQGLISLLSELITKGAGKYKATDIADIIDYYGAHLSTFADYESMSLNIYSLKKYFEKIFEITSEIIRYPSFENEEIERVKIQRINSLISNFDDGEYIAGRLFKSKVHGISPYSFNVDGTASTIDALTKEDFISAHNKYFIPENLLVVIVGDIENDEAVKITQKYFSDLKNGSYDRLNLTLEGSFNRNKIFIAERKQAVQSDIVIGHLTTKRKTPDYIPIVVMNTILGGFFTSRINKNLREVNGFTYGAHSYFNCYKLSGDFSVETSVGNRLTVPALKEIINEIHKMKCFPVSETELSNAKNYLIGNFFLQLETSNAIASKLIYLNLFELEDDFYENFVSKIKEVTIDDVHNVAKKYLHPENLIIAVAGVSDEIKNGMEQIGEVEVLNYIE